MSDNIDMFAVDIDEENKEQVCEYSFFDFRRAPVIYYVDYFNTESNYATFLDIFSREHISKCVMHIVKCIWTLRRTERDEDCLYILFEKYVAADINMQHFTINIGAGNTLGISNAFIEVPHSQSVWYITYYWLRLIRLYFFDWYMEYLNYLLDHNEIEKLKAILARPTIHTMLCMSYEAIGLWNYTMSQPNVMADKTFYEYFTNVHHAMIKLYDDMLSPIIVSRHDTFTAEDHRQFIDMFASGAIRCNFTQHGGQHSHNPRSLLEIVASMQWCQSSSTSPTVHQKAVSKRKRQFDNLRI